MTNDGSILEKKRGVWEIQISTGRDPVSGKYKRVSRTVHGTKADAKRVRDQLKNELETGIKADAASLTFGAWCEEWLALKESKGTASPSVLHQYTQRLRLIRDLLGSSTKLRELDARTVERLLIAIRDDRTAKGIPCSDSTLRHYYGLLRQVMKTACDYDLILRNPCDRITPPKKNAVERRSLTVEEANSFLEAIDETEREAIATATETKRLQEDNSTDASYLREVRNISFILLVRLGLATGMREGELLALTWGDIDFSRSRVNVTRAMDNLNRLKAPKSAAGKRSLFVDAATMDHLCSWQPLQSSLLSVIGIQVDDATPVFSDAEGGFFTKHTFRHLWERWRKKAGFPELRFHELRHTQATQLLSVGLDVKTVQHRLGHSTAALTLDVYSHALEANDERAGMLIGNLFSQGKEERSALPEKSA